MATSAQTLINVAMAAGYDKLSDRLLKEAILAAASGSGGGGAVTQIVAGSGITVAPVGGTGVVTVTNSVGAFSYFTKVGTAYLGGDQTGNALGTTSLDVQATHTVATRVASGANSMAVGMENTASAQNCFAVGYLNTVSGTGLGNKAMGFGVSNTVSGNGTLGFGYNNTVSGSGSIGFGYANSSTVGTAVCFGKSNTCASLRSSAFGIANSIAAGNTNASAFGYANPITGSQPGISAFGYKNAASGNNSSSFGNNNTASNTRACSFGRSNQATAVDCYAFGGYNLASATGASAFGKKCTASAVNSSAFGYYTSVSILNSSAFGYKCSVLTGAAANAFGYAAVNRIAETTVINGPIMNRQANGADGGAANAFFRWCGVEVVLFSTQVDFSAAATQTITLPAGCHFYPSAVGITCTAFNAVTIQPTCSFGFTGSNAALKAAAITTNLTAQFAREEYTTLLSLTGRASLTATITVGSTSTPNYFGRFYFKGLLVEDN